MDLISCPLVSVVSSRVSLTVTTKQRMLRFPFALCSSTDMTPPFLYVENISTGNYEFKALLPCWFRFRSDSSDGTPWEPKENPGAHGFANARDPVADEFDPVALNSEARSSALGC